MTIALRVGIVVVAIVGVVFIRGQLVAPLSVPCQSDTPWPERAPHGALWKQETLHWNKAPDGYSTLVGWINAATALPCVDEHSITPRVEIRKLRIIARDETTGQERIVSEIDPREKRHFVGRLFPRLPQWFGENEGKNEMTISTPILDRLSIDLSRAPLRVYHAWTEPRITLDPTQTYFLEVEANITETARLQFGIDYWRDQESDYTGWDATCQRSSNCEGFVSDWYGDTAGEFWTLRAPQIRVQSHTALRQ